MGGDVLGGGVIVAVAAVLWLIYLVPTWNRRREFMATERNAVRLQQTLRVLAETGDVPREVKLESAARVAVAKKREYKAHEAIRTANVKATLRAARRNARRELFRVRVGNFSVNWVLVTHIRKIRATVSLVGFISLLVAIAGGGIAIVTGDVFVMVVGAILFGAALLGVAGLARVRQPRVAAVSPQLPRTVATPRTSVTDVPRQSVTQDTPRTWTPTPLPKPLYLSDEPAASRLSPVLCDDEENVFVAPITPMRVGGSNLLASRSGDDSEVLVGGQSGFAHMGVVDETASGFANLDEVLRHRRAAS